MRLAGACNRITHGRQDRWRRSLYENQFAAMLEENIAPAHPAVEMKDGFAIDTSMSLPHMDRMLEDSDKIIAERSGERAPGGSYRSYFQDVWKTEDLLEYPSFLDFITSSQVLATVANYLKCIPILSTTLPAGIRFVESNAAFDDKPGTPKDSQLYHIDYYALPNVYMIVLLRDATPEHGPFHLPAAVRFGKGHPGARLLAAREGVPGERPGDLFGGGPQRSHRILRSQGHGLVRRVYRLLPLRQPRCHQATIPAYGGLHRRHQDRLQRCHPHPQDLPDPTHGFQVA